MWSRFSNPAKFEALAKTAGPIAFWIFAACAVFGLVNGLLFAPAEQYQGESARIMYVHVPAAWMAMGSYSFIALMSLVAFVWRHSLADVAARSAALPGAVFTALALFTGAVWGKPTWGAYWVWDARLTSMLLLLFIYFGYMAVWQAVPEQARAARFARILALVGFINIPIIKFSVDWWNSLHQPASIIRADGPTIDASMLWPLFAMIIAYTALFTWLVFLGMRADLARQRIEKRGARSPSHPVRVSAESEA
jgi:heme exporter protein C